MNLKLEDSMVVNCSEKKELSGQSFYYVTIVTDDGGYEKSYVLPVDKATYDSVVNSFLTNTAGTAESVTLEVP